MSRLQHGEVTTNGHSSTTRGCGTHGQNLVPEGSCSQSPQTASKCLRKQGSFLNCLKEQAGVLCAYLSGGGAHRCRTQTEGRNSCVFPSQRSPTEIRRINVTII